MLFLQILCFCILISSIGFKKFIYFITYGYGFSISASGLFLLITQSSALEEIILAILYISYGLRLSLFLIIRNIKSTYTTKMKGQIKKNEDFKFFVLVIMWLSCALLYACQVSPLVFRILSPEKDKFLLYIGVIISLIGFFIEIEADNQKSKAKKVNPNRFVDTGLYRFCRCPNYFGEIIFWTGSFIGGIKIYDGFLQWFLALLGYIGIVYVMLSGARRIEINHNKNYGKDPQFLDYAKKTPIIIPFLPIYSIERFYWLRGWIIKFLIINET